MRKAILLIQLLFMAFSSAGLANVIVKREPPDIQRKTFDPANLPAEMPHFNPSEASAITSVSYKVSVGGNYEPLTRKKGDDGWTAVVAVHSVSITVKLEVVVWTPKGVTDKLRAHEEGHRKIHEMIYQDRAITAAKAAGAVADGKRFTGQGADWKTAYGNAINPVLDGLGKTYLADTADVDTAINNIYDELTRHGSNDMPEDTAIKEAFVRYAKEHPATQPAK